LDVDLFRGQPEALRQWLQFGFETIDAAAVAMFQVGTAAEQVSQARRLDLLREMLRELFTEIRQRSAALPSGEDLANQAAV
jgi:hypothetical protein